MFLPQKHRTIYCICVKSVYKKSQHMIGRILGLRRYLQMIGIIALTDFKTRYKNSILGYMWSLLLPLAQFGVLYFIASNLLQSDLPFYPLYLLLGIIVWNFFLESTSSGMQIILSKAHLVLKLSFPRIVLIIASTLTHMMTLGLNLLIFAVIAFFSGLSLHIPILAVPLVFGVLYLFVMGVSLLLSAFFLKFRDLLHMWQIVTQMLFWMTPIFYDRRFFPEHYQFIFEWNPVARIIELFRGAIVYGEMDWRSFLVAYAIATVTFLIGYKVFKMREPYFAEDF